MEWVTFFERVPSKRVWKKRAKLVTNGTRETRGDGQQGERAQDEAEIVVTA